MGLDMLGVEAFEGTIARLLKEDQDGQNLRWMQPRCSSTAALSGGQELALSPGLKALPKRIHGAIQVE